MPPRPGGVEMAAMVSTMAAVTSGMAGLFSLTQFNCRERSYEARSSRRT